MSGRSCKAEAEAQLAAVDSTLKGKEAECAAKAEATQATLKEDNTKLVKNKKLTGKLTTEAAAAAAFAAATSLTKSYYEAATAAAAGAVEVKMQAAAHVPLAAILRQRRALRRDTRQATDAATAGCA